jgi:hypothetical protein
MSDVNTARENGKKILLVSSPVQAILMNKVLIDEIRSGFWANHRPSGHGDHWTEVEAIVSTDGQLGPINWSAPRTYNVLNLDFFNPNADKLVALAKSVKPNSNERSVKKELIELGRIIGGRLASRTSEPIKLERGNHKPGTLTASVRKAREAGCTLADVIALSKSGTAAASVKPKTTTVKKRVEDAGLELTGAIAGPITHVAALAE